MAYFITDNKFYFPPVEKADPDGLLAIGGDLSPERLLLAYRNGNFPWYEDEPILWWCPDPRFVLFPKELKINRTAQLVLKKNEFDFTMNKAFADVIHECKKIPRPGQAGTWITNEVEKAYNRMHTLGHAHSAEVWKDGKLAGGLYGIKLGNVFFGESMFSKVSNASKFAFILFVQQIKKEGAGLIDCQVYTKYLESFGARMISRKDFIKKIKSLIAP